RMERRERKEKPAAERRGVDGHGHCRQTASGDHLSEQHSEGVHDDGRLLVQLPNHLGAMVSHLSHRLAREHLRMRVGLRDSVGVIGPSWLHRRVAGLFEDCRPAVPALRQKPEAVDEYDWSSTRRVCAANLIRKFGNCRYRHRILLHLAETLAWSIDRILTVHTDDRREV